MSVLVAYATRHGATRGIAQGTDTVDAKGNDVRIAAEPKEFAELRGVLDPRDEHVFWGAYDPDAAPVGLAEALGQRVLRMLPAAREALPAGDFRDWPEIDGWAESIAEQLVNARAGPAAS